MIGCLQTLAPVKMQTFSFGGCSKYGSDYALSLTSRVTHTFSVRNVHLDKRKFEAIFKKSSHLQNLEIIDCSFQDLIDLDFEAGSPYSIKILKIFINTPNVVDLIDEIVKAISKCSLKNSLKQIKVNSNRDHYKLWNMILAQHGLSHIEVILSA